MRLFRVRRRSPFLTATGGLSRHDRSLSIHSPRRLTETHRERRWDLGCADRPLLSTCRVCTRCPCVSPPLLLLLLYHVVYTTSTNFCHRLDSVYEKSSVRFQCPLEENLISKKCSILDCCMTHTHTYTHMARMYIHTENGSLGVSAGELQIGRGICIQKGTWVALYLLPAGLRRIDSARIHATRSDSAIHARLNKRSRGTSTVVLRSHRSERERNGLGAKLGGHCRSILSIVELIPYRGDGGAVQKWILIYKYSSMRETKWERVRDEINTIYTFALLSFSLYGFKHTRICMHAWNMGPFNLDSRDLFNARF